MLIKDFGQSKVYEYGIAVHHPEIDFMYFVDRHMIADGNTESHMSMKRWVDMDSFSSALRFARGEQNG